MPGAAGHLSACLLGDGVIHDKKEDRMGFDPQTMEKLGQSDLRNLLHGPDILSQESSKARKRSPKKGIREGLDHRGSMGFLA